MLGGRKREERIEEEVDEKVGISGKEEKEKGMEKGRKRSERREYKCMRRKIETRRKGKMKKKEKE